MSQSLNRMSARLADRLSAARHRRFVGRAPEQELFRSALAAPELPFHVLHLFGPGGVGKTTLLGEYALLCERAGVLAYYLDGRNVEPTPHGFITALRAAMDLSPDASPLSALASQPRHHVILIDTCETLAPLDGWLRDDFLPQLPENTLVVLAGRNPPSQAWRADPGWQTLIRTLPLRNLGPDESQAYLAKRAIPPEQHSTVLDFTHGHPLALSLVADVLDQRPGQPFQPEAAPDMVKTLLELFVQKVPGPAHRAALEACALVRMTTEALLAEMLALPPPTGSGAAAGGVRELFEWLRGLSFVETGAVGLFPHDLAREALTADLRWRNPDWYAELHRRAREYYTARLAHTRGPEQQRHLLDLIFLHRDNAVVRPVFEWQASGSLLVDAMRASDAPALAAMAARHEGDASAQIASHWLARQPPGVLVLRESDGAPAGFVTMIALPQAAPDDFEIDPGARAAWEFLQRRAPLRPGETATHFRFWMARDTYQAVSPAQSLIFVNAVRHYLTTLGLAFHFFPCAEPDFWAQVFAYADLARLSEADFEVGGRRYGVYGHDWRVTPPAAWLALLAEREVGMAPTATPAPAEPIIVLSESAFAAAVRDALRDFPRPDALRASPLLRSRLVVERAGPSGGGAERVAALQSLLKEAAETLQASPRDAKLYRALLHTYLQPAPTQEQAAEMLDLPFSTFRRHLKAGMERVVALLWQREIGG
jgi:hypothetical protein